MFNIWVLVAVYDVCMHVLMEQVKPFLEDAYSEGMRLHENGWFYSTLEIDGVIFSPYSQEVTVTDDGDGVTVIVYSTDEFPLVLHNQGDEYEEIYRALYH